MTTQHELRNYRLAFERDLGEAVRLLDACAMRSSCLGEPAQMMLEGALVDRVRKFQHQYSEDGRMELWGRILEGYCTQCGAPLPENSVCHCTNDE